MPCPWAARRTRPHSLAPCLCLVSFDEHPEITERTTSIDAIIRCHAFPRAGGLETGLGKNTLIDTPALRVKGWYPGRPAFLRGWKLLLSARVQRRVRHAHIDVALDRLPGVGASNDLPINGGGGLRHRSGRESLRMYLDCYFTILGTKDEREDLVYVEIYRDI